MVRASQQPAYVLHSLAYRETSLVVELWTRELGKISVLAKGARRPHSALRTVLLGFQPLLVSVSGRGDVKTLTAAEWVGGHLPPEGEALFSAYYLNELLMRGLLRDDPHPHLFDNYALALARLASAMPVAPTVRQFELALLAELGYGLSDHELGELQVQNLHLQNTSATLMSDEQALQLRPLTRERLSECTGWQPLMTRLWMEQLKK
jgi:DNA repair protein RecO (recombination protein O)